MTKRFNYNSEVITAFLVKGFAFLKSALVEVLGIKK